MKKQILLGACALVLGVVAACGSDKQVDKNDNIGGAAPSDTNSTGGKTSTGGGSSTGGETASTGGGSNYDAERDCYLVPTTHLEIINACTSADRVDKTGINSGLVEPSN